MKKIILAAAITAAAAGAAFAQEAPFTVMDGEVKYPGQMERYEPRGPYYGNAYYGDAYAQVPPSYYVEEPGYVMEPRYSYERAPSSAPGIYVFDGLNLNNDQNYSGK